MAAAELSVSLDIKLEQRGTFPRTGWEPTRLPRLHFYACAMRCDGALVTPWFVRLSATWRDSEFWLYLWPWSSVPGMHRVGRRRLADRPAWATTEPVSDAERGESAVD